MSTCSDSESRDASTPSKSFLRYGPPKAFVTEEDGPAESAGSKLFRLIRIGDVPAIKNYIVHAPGYILSESDHEKSTPLQVAAKLGRPDVMELIIEKVSVDQEDFIGRTALFYAVEAETNHMEVIELLLKHGATADHMDDFSSTPVRLAANQSRFDIMEKLLEYDKLSLIQGVASCQRQHGPQSPQVQYVEMLVACGADLLVRTKDNSNVLHMAANSGCLAAVRILIHEGRLLEQRDSVGSLPLHNAVAHGWADVVEYLLGDELTCIEARTQRGWTPLHLAAYHGMTDVTSILIEWKADTTAPTLNTRFTPLYMACQCSQDETAVILLAEMIRLGTFQATSGLGDSLPIMAAARGCSNLIKSLTEHAAEDLKLRDMLLGDSIGPTPAYIAISGNESSAAEILIDFGGKTEGVDKNGNKAIHCASSYGMAGVVRRLLKSGGSSICLKNAQGKTPVQLAAQAMHDETVALLLEHQNPQKTSGLNTTGWTGLHWAAQHNRLDLVRLLVAKGADISATDSDGLTAADIARRMNVQSIEMLEWLTADLHKRSSFEPKGFPDIGRPKPIIDAASICKRTMAYLLDVYGEGVIEKKHFSVFDVIYVRGPNHTMSAVARAHQMGEPRLFKWIHLPANNETWIKDLTQSAYFDQIMKLDEDAAEYEKFGGYHLAAIRPIDPQQVSQPSEDSGSESRLIAASLSGSGDSERVHGERRADFDGFNHLNQSRLQKQPDITDPNRRDDGIPVEDDESSASKQGALDYSENGHFVSTAAKEVDDGRHKYVTQPTVRDPEPGDRRQQVLLDGYYQLRAFIESCLSQEAGSRPYPFIQPFFKHIRHRDNMMPTRTEKNDIRGCRVAVAFPYFEFRKVRHTIYGQHTAHSHGIDRISQTVTNSEDLPQRISWKEAMFERSGKKEHGTSHAPLTLDQFYYHSLPSTGKRNLDQVLFRHQGRLKPAVAESERLICMVDQIWLYIIDDDTIITSCSQEDAESPSSLRASITDHFTNHRHERPEVKSVYGMIPIIFGICSKRISQWGLESDKQRLLQIFATAIANASNMEISLFEKFKKDLEQPALPLRDVEAHLGNGDLEAVNLLIEVKDILDELNIIKSVIISQQAIIEEAFHFLRGGKVHRSRGEYSKDRHGSNLDEYSNISELIEYYHTFSKLESTGQEVDKLVLEARQTQENINHLLDLRQKAANLSEAIWARKASEDTTRQGRTIMVFTVVTIIFLPITFLSSLFALDITSFPHNDAGDLSFSPRWAYSRLLGITIAVSLPLIFLAFKVNEASEFFESFTKRHTKNVTHSPASATNAITTQSDAGGRQVTLRERLMGRSLQRDGSAEV